MNVTCELGSWMWLVSLVRELWIISVDHLVFPMRPEDLPRDRAIRRSAQGRPSLALGLGLLVLFGAGLGLAGYRVLSDRRQTGVLGLVPSPPLPSASVSAQPGPMPGAIAKASDNFIVAAVQKVGPAVVRIDASRTVSSGVPEFFSDPRFQEFFGSESTPKKRVQEGSGSGFITRPDGIILTNAHVVEGADRVKVHLKDGRSFSGQVLGLDPLTDVAVVKIEARDLPVVTEGDSDGLRPGDWAIAIGNPLGLDNTVTVGIISAKGRSSSEVGVSDKRVGFLQTDAAINPGNSGGPLLNARGQVIGMNTAIIRNAQGLGFAIPIRTAQKLADQLIATGKVVHPFLGIEMVTLNPEVIKELQNKVDLSFRVAVTEGAMISGVLAQSPAERAGVKEGDVVVRVGTIPVKTAQDVQDQVAQSPIGQPLAVAINRGGQGMVLQVKPEEMPQENQRSASDQP
jgi:serine protease Do